MKYVLYVMIGLGVFAGKLVCGETDGGVDETIVCITLWPIILTAEVTAACVGVRNEYIEKIEAEGEAG